MGQHCKTASLWCLSILFATTAVAQTVTHKLVAPNSLPRLIASADAIITGTGTAILIGDTASATITVERALKGSLQRGALVSATWTTSDRPSNSASTNVHGLFYLRHTSDGAGWTLLPVVLGSGWLNTVERTPTAVPNDISAAASASLPESASIFDRVALELVTTVESGSSLSFRDLLGAAHEIPSPVFSAAFRRFLNSGNPSLTCIGAAGMLAEGDPMIPGAIRKNYKAWSLRAGWRGVILELTTSYATTDSRALSALGALATDETAPSDLRVASAVALAAIHTPQTLPFLARLLDDPNTALEAAGVGGLAMFANHVPVRGHEPMDGQWKYRSDDTIAHSVFDEGVIRQRGPYYLQFWKSWWSQNQFDFAQ